MNETLFVEFVSSHIEYPELKNKINALGEDFVHLGEWGLGNYTHITGKITSMCASMITLQDEFLANRMRVSYITADLKNKYRT